MKSTRCVPAVISILSDEPMNSDRLFCASSIVIFSLFIAVLLNDKIAGRAAFRAILFVPVILSTGLIESIDAQNSLSEFMGSSESIDMGTGESTAAPMMV